MVDLYCAPKYIRIDIDDYYRNMTSIDEALQQAGCKMHKNYPYMFIKGNLYKFIYKLTVDEYVLAK